MFTRNTLTAFLISVGFWLFASAYYAWHASLTARSHLAKAGLAFAAAVAILGLYALVGGPTIRARGGRQKLRRQDVPIAKQISLGMLAAAAVGALFSVLLYL